ncbi:major outer membrane protein FomA [Fusobacterium varium]|uniref:major outer membrane protein FomA n=2 Tax=Fusobacterium varium TaxID=856 RepID=UPI000E41BCBC|nr:hypothetical protein [Fusobacterium varium]RGJ30893.1 hypothetical protein DXD66_03580 [Fusobacterium varium]
MRKLALLLGSLLVVASASAKEVVPAPVVVEEAPVQVIEKEVIVYRDKEVGFRPNGNVDLQYRYYGDTEGQNKGTWHGGDNNYSRIQLSGKINMTEKQQLQYRIRNWNSLNEKENQMKTETRFRYFYNHGLLGDSKVNFTSRVQYRDKNSGAQDVEYMAMFNFADYMFNNDYVKTTDFTVAPRYAYVWNKNTDAYDNQLGVDLYSWTDLPYGFSFEFNLYTTQHFYGQDQDFNDREADKDKNFTIDMEAYLRNTTNLYTNGNLGIDFVFEGGYDQYNWSQEKAFVNSRGKQEDAKYSLYAWPAIQANYQATPNVVVYVSAGAEYRNWAVEVESEASHWRWQPTVIAGFKTTF